MRRLTGRGATLIALYITITTLIGLGAGFAFGYGYPEAGAALTIGAVLATGVTGIEVKCQLEGK